MLRGTLADLPAPLPPPVTFVVGAVAALDLTASPEAPPVHIPDGFLTGEAAAIGWTAVAAAAWRVCLHRVRGEQRERDLPVAGLAAAFFLVGDAPMFPVTSAPQGHLLGGAAGGARCSGPWLGAMTIAVVCAIQALALGDGGITTLGLGDRQPRARPRVRRLPAAARAAPACCRPRRAGSRVAAGVAAWVCVDARGAACSSPSSRSAPRVDIDLGTIAGSARSAPTR